MTARWFGREAPQVGPATFGRTVDPNGSMAEEPTVAITDEAVAVAAPVVDTVHGQHLEVGPRARVIGVRDIDLQRRHVMTDQLRMWSGGMGEHRAYRLALLPPVGKVGLKPAVPAPPPAPVAAGPSRLRTFLEPEIREGLVTLETVEVIAYRAADEPDD